VPRLLLTLSVMCLLGLGIWPAVAAESPSPSFPPPGPPYPDPVEGVHVYDYAGVLRDDTVAAFEDAATTFEEQVGIGLAVYTQVKPESDTLEEAACDAAALLEQWSMGRGGRPYGLVVLFDLDASLCHGQVQFYARPDIGVAGLTDTERQAIFEGVMLPALRECDFDAALTAAMEGISAVEAGPVVLGGRIEVAGAGVALAFPPGWYAFDLTHPNLLTEMGSSRRSRSSGSSSRAF